MADNDFFAGAADEIFLKAQVNPADAPEMYEDVKQILASKMATLSATMGMSYKRIELYNEQKESLAVDLVKLKQENHLR